MDDSDAAGEEAVVVDTNAGEDGLYGALKEHADLQRAHISRKRLDVGDVLLQAAGRRVIVERKTWDDLCASLRDGRYKEQKARQMRAVAEDDSGRTAVVYLVCDPLPHWHAQSHGVRNGHVESALVATAVRDRIPVLRVRDTEAAAEAVACLLRRLREGELDPSALTQKETSLSYACYVKSSRKKANMTEDVVWQCMLAAVPGVSAAKAAAISEKYPNATALMAEIGDGAKGVKRLADTQAGAKKLGPAVAKRLRDSLLGGRAAPL